MPEAPAVRTPTVPRPQVTGSFACTWQLRWDAAWVQVTGELDIGTSDRFRRALEQAQRAAPRSVLDLRQLSFIDSAGVHVILDIAAEVRRDGGRLLIARGSAQVDRMLTLTDVGKQATILDLNTGGPAPALSPRPHTATGRRREGRCPTTSQLQPEPL
jgi:anti-anti-sigma factor